jgi:hypothetical protein
MQPTQLPLQKKESAVSFRHLFWGISSPNAKKTAAVREKRDIFLALWLF